MADAPPAVATSTRFIDAVHLTLQPLLLNVISVFALAYIIRCLGATAFGQWAVGTTINAALMFVVGMGLRPLFVRALAEHPEQAADLLAEQLGLRTALGVLAATLATVAAIALRYSSTIVAATLLTGLATLLIGIWTTFADYLQAIQRVRLSATIGTVAGVVLTAVSVTVAWAGGGAVALAAAYLTGPLITAVALGYVVSRRFGCPVRLRWDAAQSTRLLADSRPLALQLFLHSVRDRGEQLIVPRLLGIETFGFFAAGMMPADRLETIPDSLNTSYFTSIAAAYSRPESRDRAINDIRHLLLTSLLVCLAASFAMSGFAPLVANILFRGGGATAAFVMTVTVWGLPLTALSGSMTSILQATGQHARAARAGIISTVLGTGISLSLIALFGLPGAAWGVVVRQAIGALVIAVPFAQAIGAITGVIPIGRVGIAVTLTALLLWFARNHLGGSIPAQIAANIAGLAVYAALVLLLRILPWSPRQLWRA